MKLDKTPKMPLYLDSDGQWILIYNPLRKDLVSKEVLETYASLKDAFRNATFLGSVPYEQNAQVLGNCSTSFYSCLYS